MSTHIKIICIGKLKKGYWQQAEQAYVQRLKRYYPVQLTELKDGPSHLPAKERRQQEAKAIRNTCDPKDRLICLDHQGRAMSSPQLATRLQSWFLDPGLRPCFVLGGAFGLDQSLLQDSSFRLGFGPMTLPHELARIVLLEQLYRAATILANHPYHH